MVYQYQIQGERELLKRKQEMIDYEIRNVNQLVKNILHLINY